GVTTVLDGGTLRPGAERLLPYIDHPVVSERFALALAEGDGVETALERLLALGGRAATVTRGALGSVTLTDKGERIDQPAFDVDPTDTTGCGDVFHGGYIYGLLQDWPLPRTLRFAAACAALKTREIGGRAAIPRRDEVERFLRG
ncbi:MAG: sugar kinase, partial [Desulfuromonadales bacterium]|nr:sugar kinase [Desulfuromonadales bacterium]NIS40050.1 sugar kinase [Desulfuromonadales bacterium]